MADQPTLDFSVPDGCVVIENVTAADREIPDALRIIPPGGFWYAHEDEAQGLEGAAGAVPWAVRRDLTPNLSAQSRKRMAELSKPVAAPRASKAEQPPDAPVVASAPPEKEA